MKRGSYISANWKNKEKFTKDKKNQTAKTQGHLTKYLMAGRSLWKLGLCEDPLRI